MLLRFIFNVLQLNHKSSGKTPLQVAAHQGHIEIVVLLIQQVNLEVSDDDGDTALHYSAFGCDSFPFVNYDCSYIASMKV